MGGEEIVLDLGEQGRHDLVWSNKGEGRRGLVRSRRKGLALESNKVEASAVDPTRKTLEEGREEERRTAGVREASFQMSSRRVPRLLAINSSGCTLACMSISIQKLASTDERRG